MKLIYLWIESYKCIEKQGYLLNANYEVKFDKKKNELSVSPKESLDSMLYGDNISVTAIVGDNGAGKSTLLDAIRIVLFDDLKRGTEISGFLIWENEGDLQLFPFMEDNQLPEIKQPSILKKENVIDELPDNSDLIYYSDFLDEKYYSKKFDGDINVNEIRNSINLPICFQDRSSAQVNISTSFLLRECKGKVIDFFHGDTKKQIDFYGSLQKDEFKLPFDAPTSLSVVIDFLGIDLFKKILDNPLDYYKYKGKEADGSINTNAYVIGLLNEMTKTHENQLNPILARPLMAEQILQWDIFIAYIYEMIAEYENWYEDQDDYSMVDEKIKEVISVEIDALKRNHDIIWDVLYEIFHRPSEKNIAEEFKPYWDFYQKMMTLLKEPKHGNFHIKFKIMELTEENTSVSYFKDRYDYSSSIDFEEFKKFFDSYIEVAHELDLLKFSWGMSSGESNMFSIFARMYEALEKCQQDSVILLFDELDSSFHPKWQQKIIGSLTQFLRVNYPEKKFQVILTTHSPVLLSDIPRENVIFMRKDCNVETEHNQTFAANIASLYYDSFFMEKGSIGEVARNSIVNLLDIISDLTNENRRVCCSELLKLFLDKQYQVKNSRFYPEEYAEKFLQLLIDNIGEDIWRYKANEQFHLLLEKNKTNEEIEEELLEKLKEVEKSKGKGYVKNILKSLLEEEDQ